MWGWFEGPTQPPQPVAEWTPWSLVIGIVLTVLGAFIISIGSLLDASERRSHDSHLPVWKSQKASGFTMEMVVGLLLVTMGNFLHIVGLWFAPASLLAPTNAVGLVSTHILAKVMFNEPVTVSAILSTIGISAGIVICGIASVNAGAATLSSENRERLYLSTWLDPGYQAFILVCLALVVALYFFIFELQLRQTNEEFMQFRNAPHFDTYQRIPNEVQEQVYVVDDESSAALSQAQGNALGILAGIIGSQTVCEIKEVEALLNLLATKGIKNGILMHKSAMLSIPMLAACGLGQWPYLNLAYRLGSPQLVSACYYVSWTVLGSIGGFVKFKEHHGMSPNERIMYAIGLTINLIAILLACSKSIQDLARMYFSSASEEPGMDRQDYHSIRARVLANFTAAPFMDRVLPALQYKCSALASGIPSATTIELTRPSNRRRAYRNMSL
eukprot:Blabericola_migrator_1__3572@NODE_2061_length_3346_cov_124_000305_g1306_i0_p1_GENE_NODE_2061_length_3346_cov_124_000305_g1306_i0NODE_2061_length_3346_cov_124_000305_g1306_i0_p1_ORF_typecomplete_len443_score45_43Mg_trans_NIPA/PF05653_14/3_2e33TMEM234/PF10639_9/7_7e05TMEM234/PF10639_9/9_2e03Nuc_sug_transp/PF04142_15/0_00038Nuc_sug_transp/PF04142_15/2_9e03EamA/PF00892_20/1_5e02EamA/PF00892_20/0_0011EamA/PF00892_20/6_7e02EamA/PF00892_20/2e02PUNUT/PF16913_5/6_2PUNUT/PF16913_5/0_047CrgA/PF06781_12/0_9